MSDRLRITFLYDLGDHVRWDDCEAPEDAVYTIVWRQWSQGQASTWVQYGLALDADAPVVTAFEPDLIPREDAP